MTPAVRGRLPAWLRVPYLDGGRTVAGWDCWGLVVHVGAAAFGDRHQEFAGIASAFDDDSVVAAAMAAKLPLYRRAGFAPGAVALLQTKGLPLHVGLMLGPRHMLHALQGVGTVLTDFADPRDANWRRRAEAGGAYVLN